MHPSGAGAHNHAVHTVMGEDFIGPPLCSHVLVQALGTAVLAGACSHCIPHMHAGSGHGGAGRGMRHQSATGRYACGHR